MYLNSTVAVPGYIDNAYPIQPGAPIEIPLDLLPLLPSGQPAPGYSSRPRTSSPSPPSTPRPASSKITVLAIGGGLNYAAAS